MTDFLTDPSWYKDAVIYELHVRSFYDASNDGYGDFEGLRRKLPYLESLGVNTLWLLPFLESPLKDDGYDTADYFKVLPVHGTIDDFKAFLKEAHNRGMRVITELVLNHTSDQHPWFQEARDPSSEKHDWYVWGDTTERYGDARIIFTDTEVSNWSWDRQAGKYYWHRFFSHQPDLNYDNPDVRAEMKEVLFYWLDMGVDGLRLDAVPYLYEREGTNCENLPETIDYLKELRSAIEERYGPGKIMLAEANQWPEDTLPYFADGEGVQMAFNFPIMPRMYMALRRENRHPIVEMLELTSGIPDECQWAIFLRNHDELTLEMVTDEERDYMYHEYAAEPRFRINVGIRRRLAPLLGGERKRIELMNALLLSLKGSPILYYGDEIGMGDDPFLGDRNGVRTPMQWSPDKNAGFSRASHHRLFMPTIDRGPFSYEFVNVEEAEADPYSLLNFMKRLLAIRNRHTKVFGRGSIELLPLENQHVLAFVREYEDEKILVVANLSRFAQSIFLSDSDTYKGYTPVELFSQSPFPAIGDSPYHMLLGPHGFFWFSLEPEESVSAERLQGVQMRPDQRSEDLPVLSVAEGIQNLLVRTMVRDRGMKHLESLLPDYVADQRWYGEKDRGIASIEIDDAVRLQTNPFPIYLTLLRVRTVDDSESLYVLPLTLSFDGAADAVLDEHDGSVIAWVDGPEGRGLLHDATVRPDFWLRLFRWWLKGGRGRSLRGVYKASIDRSISHDAVETATLLSGEQSNSSAIIDDRFFIKLYRRMEEGTNPETELLHYLTDAGFKFIPQLYGRVTFRAGKREYAMGILQDALPVETDGWNRAIDITHRFFERVSEMTPPAGALPKHFDDDVPGWLEDVAPEMLSLARLLGIRTAEMHLALARAEDGDLTPLPGSDRDVVDLVDRIRGESAETRRMLARHDDRLADLPRAAEWDAGLDFLERVTAADDPPDKIRIHGDFHLGQVLLAAGELYILDFEGEPARSLEERRRRDIALRDVAGMLRSLEYAVLAAWNDQRDGRQGGEDKLGGWARALTHWCEAVFQSAYFGTAGDAGFLPSEEARRSYLWAFLFDKALYEVRYELNHRPTWTWLPLRGLKRLLAEARMEPDAPTDEPTGKLTDKSD
ncbi:MAG: maltose alpha-D-glucosyltransferase [Rhodothermales bacterium]